jgi:hypothetical protein
MRDHYISLKIGVVWGMLAAPTQIFCIEFSDIPSIIPSDVPSLQPNGVPSYVPSVDPSFFVSTYPSDNPSIQPSDGPSIQPSDSPSSMPTDDGILCSDVAYNGTSFPVCYKATMTAISGIGMFENGTETPASQLFNYEYDIYSANTIPIGTGTTIRMQRSGEVQGQDDRTECDFVEINGQPCTSCRYCDDDVFSSDCTNIEHGRMVDCESVFPVYFPLLPVAALVNAYHCSEIYDGLETFLVCYSLEGAVISSTSVSENGTAFPPEQIFVYFFNVYDPASLAPAFNITIARSEERCHHVEVDGYACASCSYCGQETITADCTNLQHGRQVECEAVEPLFFPLKAETFYTVWDSDMDPADELFANAIYVNGRL